MKKYDLSIVIPVLNEELVLRQFLEKFFKEIIQINCSYEIILVDNGSIDDSVKIAESFPLRITQEVSRGYGRALLKGFKEAEGEFIAYLDCDGSYSVSDLIRLYNKIKESNSDKVIGTRINDSMHLDSMPLLHRFIGTPVLNFLCYILHGVKTSDVNSGIRVFRAEILKRFCIESSGMEFASEFLLKSSKSKCKITEVPITYQNSLSLTRKPHLKPIRDGLRHLRTIVTL